MVLTFVVTTFVGWDLGWEERSDVLQPARYYCTSITATLFTHNRSNLRKRGVHKTSDGVVMWECWNIPGALLLH